MVLAVYSRVIVTSVPPVAAVNQPLNAQPERVGVGRVAKRPFALTVALEGVTEPLFALNETTIGAGVVVVVTVVVVGGVVVVVGGVVVVVGGVVVVVVIVVVVAIVVVVGVSVVVIGTTVGMITPSEVCWVVVVTTVVVVGGVVVVVWTTLGVASQVVVVPVVVVSVVVVVGGVVVVASVVVVGGEAVVPLVEVCDMVVLSGSAVSSGVVVVSSGSPCGLHQSQTGQVRCSNTLSRPAKYIRISKTSVIVGDSPSCRSATTRAALLASGIFVITSSSSPAR